MRGPRGLDAGAVEHVVVVAVDVRPLVQLHAQSLRDGQVGEGDAVRHRELGPGNVGSVLSKQHLASLRGFREVSVVNILYT